MLGATIIGALDGILLATGPLGGAADPYAAYLVYDTFTDSDDVALASHTPDKDTEAGGWSVVAGTMSIQSNRARQTAAVTAGYALIDTGQANITSQSTVYFGSGLYPAAVTRATDVSNLIHAVANKGNGKAYVEKCEAGGWSTLAEVASGLTWADGDTIKFVTDDDDLLTMWQNDTELAGVTNAFNNTATKAGIRTGNDITDQDHDDFWVTSP